MTTIIKLVVASILALLMSSCNFPFGVRGNGNVQTIERTVGGTYDKIEVSNGLDVYLTQADTESISVQADENLHDMIITKIEGNVLKIYTDGNISFSKAQKVMVSFKNVSIISSSSGSDVYSTNTFKTQSIKLETSSGSDMTLDINAQSITCSTSSGSDLKLSGSTTKLTANASSGSDINAKDLKAETTHVEASSGADISVNTSKELYADADSGGDIKYTGNPSKVKKNDTVSGSINEE
ncbi:MAG: head GIN domain-containing protein [Aquaticitalea sp.]